MVDLDHVFKAYLWFQLCCGLRLWCSCWEKLSQLVWKFFTNLDA